MNKFGIFCLLIFIVSCNQKNGIAEINPGYQSQIQQMRKEKDLAFANDVKHSPVSNFIDSFNGLKYFEFNNNWVLKPTIEVLTAQEDAKIIDTKGVKRNYIKTHRLIFDNGSEKFNLFLYSDTQTHTFFLPFKDQTNGSETYEGGRYIEIASIENLVVDFNQAYNPFCHYNHGFACPVVPVENHLKIKVIAGEKKLR